jgi:hypothetical protein
MFAVALFSLHKSIYAAGSAKVPRSGNYFARLRFVFAGAGWKR